VLVADPDALTSAHDLLAAELAAVDAACSRFRGDSELWRVNHAPGRPVPVSPLFAEALAVALDAAELTGGDVDPTCGQSLVRLGYDRDFAQARRHTGPLRQPPMPAGSSSSVWHSGRRYGPRSRAMGRVAWCHSHDTLSAMWPNCSSARRMSAAVFGRSAW